MQQTPKSLGHMLAAWNETDVERIREHLDKALGEEIIFADPDYLIEGSDAFEAMVRKFRIEHPKAKTLPTSRIDCHHNRYRYNWIVRESGVPDVTGMDIVQLNEAGLIVRVDGFFGSL